MIVGGSPVAARLPLRVVIVHELYRLRQHAQRRQGRQVSSVPSRLHWLKVDGTLEDAKLDRYSVTHTFKVL